MICGTVPVSVTVPASSVAGLVTRVSTPPDESTSETTESWGSESVAEIVRPERPVVGALKEPGWM